MAGDLAKIKKETAKTHRVEGRYGNVKWQLVLANRNRETNKLEEIDSAARFNTSTPGNIVAFWRTEKELMDYLRKCGENRMYIENNLMKLDHDFPDTIRNCVTDGSKKGMIETFEQKKKAICNFPPHSNLLLAESAACAFHFDLIEIQEIIDKTVQGYLNDFGSFPVKSQLITAYTSGESVIFNGYQVCLKIEGKKT